MRPRDWWAQLPRLRVHWALEAWTAAQPEMKRAEQLRPPRPQGVDPRAPHTRASRSRAGLDFVGKFLFFLLARELHSLCVFPPFDKDRNPANKIPSSLSPGPAPRRRSRGKGSPRGSRCHRLARDRAVPLGDPGHQDEERGAGEGAGNRNWRRRREQPTARARWCRRHVVQSAERSLQVLPGPGGGQTRSPVTSDLVLCRPRAGQALCPRKSL